MYNEGDDSEKRYHEIWKAENENLQKRARLIREYLSSIIGDEQQQKILKSIIYMMNQQEEDGSWGSGFSEDWKPIETTQVISALLSLGLNVDTQWEINKRSFLRFGSIGSAMGWLLAVQR